MTVPIRHYSTYAWKMRTARCTIVAVLGAGALSLCSCADPSLLADTLSKIVTVNGAPLGSGGGQSVSGVGKRYTTIEGIKAYHYRKPWKYGSAPEPRLLSWSGSRDAEGYATGNGTLKLIWRNTERNEYSGTMEKGRWQGAVQAFYYVEGPERRSTGYRTMAQFDGGRRIGNWVATAEQKTTDKAADERRLAEKAAAAAAYKKKRMEYSTRDRGEAIYSSTTQERALEKPTKTLWRCRKCGKEILRSDKYQHLSPATTTCKAENVPFLGHSWLKIGRMEQ